MHAMLLAGAQTPRTLPHRGCQVLSGLQTAALTVLHPACPQYCHMCSNGTDQWVFRNASHLKIPASFNYEDVMLIPANMNIKAGASWLHMIDKP
jgi:hypothetical protein